MGREGRIEDGRSKRKEEEREMGIEQKMGEEEKRRRVKERTRGMIGRVEGIRIEQKIEEYNI